MHIYIHCFFTDAYKFPIGHRSTHVCVHMHTHHHLQWHVIKSDITALTRHLDEKYYHQSPWNLEEVYP
jgi:hypothetical protein